MEKIELEGLDQICYKETFDNGMVGYFIPYKNKNNYSMHYVTRYGSVDTSFTVENKEITVPAGSAHFLEHKKFETKDGIDPFSFAAQSGTDCNAATYYQYTRYLFQGNKAFKENLDYLLTYVHTPYFTEENVEKEKGIIVEELLQYQDLVDFKLDVLSKEGLLSVHPMRVDIGGTVESVKSITKEDLDILFETFYQPSNMFLVITGNFDVEEAINIIKNNKVFNEVSSNKEIIRKKYDEPANVNFKEKEIKFNTSSTKLAYSLKIEIPENNDLFKTHLYYSLMLSMLFGVSSDFREKAKKEELYTAFFYSKEHLDNYVLITFVADTEKPNELVEKIKEEIKNMDLKEEELERIKKVWISSEVMMIDNIDMTLDNIVYDVIEYKDIIPNKVPIYRTLNFKELTEIISNTNFENDSKVIIRPKKAD